MTKDAAKRPDHLRAVRPMLGRQSHRLEIVLVRPRLLSALRLLVVSDRQADRATNSLPYPAHLRQPSYPAALEIALRKRARRPSPSLDLRPNRSRHCPLALQRTLLHASRGFRAIAVR